MTRFDEKVRCKDKNGSAPVERKLRHALFRAVTLGCSIALLCGAGIASAAEGGSGVYVLGFTGPQAGLLPEAGTYLGYNFYAYKGDASASVSASRQIPIPGSHHKLPAQLNGSVNIDLDSWAHIFTLTHVFSQKWLGGQPGLSLTVPHANADLGLGSHDVLTLNSPSGKTFDIPFGGRADASRGGLGDSTLTGLLGWHDGRLHTMAMFNVYAPTGGYDKNRLVNVGRNHWAFEPMLATTYLNELTGLELSSAAGITFNRKNPATEYRSGNEFHLDLTALQHFSESFYLGLAAYAYHQLTNDTGAGATTALKGRVYGIGPVLGGTIALGPKQKLFVNARYYQESGATHRLEGKTFLLTAALQF